MKRHRLPSCLPFLLVAIAACSSSPDEREGSSAQAVAISMPCGVLCRELVPRTRGDVNGDQKADIALLGSGSANTIPVAISAGNGSFTFLSAAVTGDTNFPSYTGQGSAISLLGDFNGDGLADMAVVGGVGASGPWTTIPVAFGAATTPRSFNAVSSAGGSNTLIEQGIISDPGTQVVTSDVNGDFNDDLVIVNNGSVFLGLSNGDGTFKGANTSAVVGDMNPGADGNLGDDRGGEAHRRRLRRRRPRRLRARGRAGVVERPRRLLARRRHHAHHEHRRVDRAVRRLGRVGRRRGHHRRLQRRRQDRHRAHRRRRLDQRAGRLQQRRRLVPRDQRRSELAQHVGEPAGRQQVRPPRRVVHRRGLQRRRQERHRPRRRAGAGHHQPVGEHPRRALERRRQLRDPLERHRIVVPRARRAGGRRVALGQLGGRAARRVQRHLERDRAAGHGLGGARDLHGEPSGAGAGRRRLGVPRQLRPARLGVADVHRGGDVHDPDQRPHERRHAVHHGHAGPAARLERGRDVCPRVDHPGREPHRREGEECLDNGGCNSATDVCAAAGTQNGNVDPECVACGGPGHQPCSSGLCERGYSPSPVNGQCIPCGTLGAIACNGNGPACTQYETGPTPQGTCDWVCGKDGQVCCGGDYFGHGGVCHGTGLACDYFVFESNKCEVSSSAPSGGGESSCADLTCYESCGTGCLQMKGSFCSDDDATLAAAGCDVYCGSDPNDSAICATGSTGN